MPRVMHQRLLRLRFLGSHVFVLGLTSCSLSHPHASASIPVLYPTPTYSHLASASVPLPRLRFLFLACRIFTTDLRYDTHLRPHRSCTCTVHLLAHTTECKSISLSVHVHPSRAGNTRLSASETGTDENILDEPECSERPSSARRNCFEFVTTCYDARSAFILQRGLSLVYPLEAIAHRLRVVCSLFI